MATLEKNGVPGFLKEYPYSLKGVSFASSMLSKCNISEIE